MCFGAIRELVPIPTAKSQWYLKYENEANSAVELPALGNYAKKVSAGGEFEKYTPPQVRD